MESQEISAHQTRLMRYTMQTFQNVFHFSNWVRLDLCGTGVCDRFIFHFVDNIEVNADNRGGVGQELTE